MYYWIDLNKMAPNLSNYIQMWTPNRLDKFAFSKTNELNSHTLYDACSNDL